jgi:UDP-N-acetylglucosamine 2-epimerase (non-hydrolysing)/GDP/UDP-N,N'-diacetylbacillosamine 2-epimerase (hydrolysing)
MGEEEWRVHRAGASSLDHLRRSPLMSRGQVEERLDIHFTHPTALIAYHPTTIARDPTREADALFSALESVPAQLLFCYPNADAGSRALIERTNGFIRRVGSGRVFVNLEPVLYWSLLRCVDLLLGNSSSGIMEAASFAVPVVNVGIRQRGRERACNVLDAEASADSILDRVGVALAEDFRHSLRGMENPYGDGHAAERIVSVLTSVPLGEELLIKRAPAVDQGAIESSK